MGEDAPGGGSTASGGRVLGLRQELRDAVTPRAVALVIGVLVLQLGFIASYVGALHQPKAHRMPVAVTAPGGRSAALAAQLNALPGGPLRAEPVADEAAGRARLTGRHVYAVFVAHPRSPRDRLLVSSAAGGAAADAAQRIFAGVEKQRNRALTVRDVRPAGTGDARSLSSFYLVVGWMVGGYLVASILGVSAGSRPANRRRAVVRLGSIAVYAAVSGLVGALIVGPGMGALPSHVLGLWGLGALLVFAAGAFTMALQVLFGLVGIGLAIGLFVVLGNPSAGGAYPVPLMPAFWRAIGAWIPTGAGTWTSRSIVYFDWARTTVPLLVIGGYALAGLVVAVLAVPRRARAGTTAPLV